MKSSSGRGGRGRSTRTSLRLFAMAIVAVVSAGAMLQAAAAEAETPAAWTPPPVQFESAPDWAHAAFRGLSCSRCNSATQFCVLNPVRYEYACAPLGSVACISASRTHWCPASRGCWAGRCR